MVPIFNGLRVTDSTYKAMARLITEPFIIIASVGHRETCERRGENKAINHLAHLRRSIEICIQLHYHVIYSLILLPYYSSLEGNLYTSGKPITYLLFASQSSQFLLVYSNG